MPAPKEARWIGPSRSVELPRAPFFWTIDQIARILQVPESWLNKRTYHLGRSLGRDRRLLLMINLAEPDEPPMWRISDVELRRWLAVHGNTVRTKQTKKRDEL